MANINIGGSGGIPVTASNEPVWGVFLLGTSTPIYTPTEGGTLSFVSLNFSRRINVSNYPLEDSGFASYNKSFQPFNPVVTLSLNGSIDEKIAFLSAINAACSGTQLYTIETPDIYYSPCTVEEYRYQRSATRGASLLIVEISFKQVYEISSAYANAPTSNAQSPASQPSSSGGNVQGTSPNAPSSLLYGAAKGIGIGVN